MKVEHEGLNALVEMRELWERLYTALAALSPLEALEPMTDSVTLPGSGTIAGAVVFKHSARMESWRITGFTAKSAGGHTFTIEAYVESSSSSGRVNLIDTSSGFAEYVSDRSSPIVVGSGQVLIIYVSSGTASDVVSVTIQGYRQPTLGPVHN